MSSRLLLYSLFLVLVLALSACTPGSGAIVHMIQYVADFSDSGAEPSLDPRFAYLRISVGGRLVFLALGYVDPDPKGPIEVWYSAERETLRFQNGRLVGVAGLKTEWLKVEVPTLPSWKVLAQQSGSYRWNRIRDIMPGYRVGQRDTLVIEVVDPPQKSELRNLDASSLIWFEEHFEESSPRLLRYLGLAGKSEVLPPARYAVDLSSGDGTVVYGEQCIAPEICISWQRWPVRSMGSASGK